MKTLKETKILGFPLWMFLILAALMMVMAANDWMLTNMVGALAFAMVVGTLLGWVGDHIPVWKTWFGGGMLFACLVAGAFNTFNLIGEGSKEALNTFNGTTGFLDLYILILITGSVLSVDRKMLLKSFVGYIPTILAGIVGALALAGVVGAVTGVGAIEAITGYAIPGHGRRQRRRHPAHEQDVGGCHRRRCFHLVCVCLRHHQHRKPRGRHHECTAQ